MSGSFDAKARAGRTSAAPSPSEGYPGLVLAATSGHYDPKTGECAVCTKVQPRRVECQDALRIWDAFDRAKEHRLKGRARAGAVVCKDCCIARLSGHKCIWWDLCWNI